MEPSRPFFTVRVLENTNESKLGGIAKIKLLFFKFLTKYYV